MSLVSVPRYQPSNHITTHHMNTLKLLSVAGGLLALLAGCVPSLQPLYTEQDLSFDPGLVGEWGKLDSKETWTFTKHENDSYRLCYTDTLGRKSDCVVHLAKVKGRLFLDLFPVDSGPSDKNLFQMHLLPVHTFMKVREIRPKLRLASLNPDWLHRFLKENPEAIRHETQNGRIILTAQPEELQAFLLQHEANEEAWLNLLNLNPKRSN